MSAVGDNIRAARKARHGSLAQLASSSGLSKGFLSQVESGTSTPSLASLERIASALGVTSVSLLSTDNQVSQNPLVVALPRLLGTARPHRSEATIEILNATESGTHLLVELPPDTELSGNSGPVPASILATVLEGQVLLVQKLGRLHIPSGGVGTWNGGEQYILTTYRTTSARLVLYVPQVLDLPLFKPVGLEPSGELDNSQLANVKTMSTGGDGPMRLVTMRAQRLAGRKPTR